MGDAGLCPRCDGRGWTWNGSREVPCSGQAHRRPKGPETIIPAEDWPAYLKRVAR